MQAVWADTSVEENNLNQSISAIRRGFSANIERSTASLLPYPVEVTSSSLRFPSPDEAGDNQRRPEVEPSRSRPNLLAGSAE